MDELSKDQVGKSDIQPDGLFNPDHCVDGGDGLRSAKIHESHLFGDSFYCIKGYAETGCGEAQKVFQHPWDTANYSQQFLYLACIVLLIFTAKDVWLFPSTVKSAKVVTVSSQHLRRGM
jgi:hypothetical protein